MAFSYAFRIDLPPLARKLWAKSSPTPKTLWRHILDSGLCAMQLAEEARFGAAVKEVAQQFALSCEEAKRLIAYLAAIHDGYGKASPAFQKKDASLAEPFFENGMISVLDKQETFRHEQYGERCFRDEAGVFQIPSLAARIFASVIALHHQGKHGEGKPPRNCREQWQALGNALHKAAIAVFDPPIARLRACKHCGAAVMTLLPFVILADWLASSEPFSHLDESQDDAAYITAACEMAQRVVRQNGLVSASPFPKVGDYQQLWPGFSPEALRPVQRAILEDADPAAGLTIIEAPMGEGKTEAGAFQAARLCGLWGKQGIYFALPTAATSNQMFLRISAMLKTLDMGEARLMHGMAWLAGQDPLGQENDDPQEQQAAQDWLRPLRRAMLAESAVGTVDQAMLSVMPIKYSCLRLLGLMGKVLVIDEIHAYDAYMSEIIERLLEWCSALHIPVILLSATLTQEKRKALVAAYGGKLEAASEAYPLITQVSEAQTRQIPVASCAKQGTFRFTPFAAWCDYKRIAQRAIEKVANGGCLCVLMNTVRDAQAVWREIQCAAPDSVLLHARFKARKRDEQEERCVRLFGKDGSQRPERAILVCTQIVEQSMDLDFDGMITQLAPIDLLLQRAGRVHRHERGPRPQGMEEAIIEVVVPENMEYGAVGAIYAPWLLQQTQLLLPQVVRVPQDVRRAIEAVYQQPADIPEAWAKMRFSEQAMQAQAGASMFPAPNAETFFGWEMPGQGFSLEEPQEGTAARTRLDDVSMRVSLLPRETMEKVIAAPVDAALARLAFENSFTIREAPPKGAANSCAKEGEGLCKNLWFVAEESLPVQIGRTRLDYDEMLGAITERMPSE